MYWYCILILCHYIYVICHFVRNDVCDDAWRSLTSYFPQLFKDADLEPLHNIFTDQRVVVSNFHWYFIISSEVIVFIAKTDFCHFKINSSAYLKNHEMLSKFDYFMWRNVWIPIRITIGFVWKISFIRYKIYFSGQIDRFYP